MRTIIGGSRTIMGTQPVLDAITRAATEKGIKPTIVLSGQAAGPDTTGANWAIAQGIPVESYPAEWGKYGKRAGVLRNQDMVNAAEAAIIIWDGQSKGTGYLIQFCEAKGIPTLVYTPALAGVS